MKTLNRRTFGKRAFLTAAGIWAVPNLLIQRANAGTISIIDRSGDNRISISNGSFARPFDVGSWTKLRVCALMQMEFTGNLTSLTPHFVMGLCSGTSNQVFDATTTNFIGIRTLSLSWTAYAGTPDLIAQTTANVCKVTKRVGSTWTDGGSLTANAIWFNRASESSDAQWGMYIVEVEKGSPNYTVTTFYQYNAIGPATHALFLSQAPQTTPVITNHVWGSGVALAFDEVAGALDCVQIGWDRTEATLEVTDLAVVKMA